MLLSGSMQTNPSRIKHISPGASGPYSSVQTNHIITLSRCMFGLEPYIRLIYHVQSLPSRQRACLGKCPLFGSSSFISPLNQSDKQSEMRFLLRSDTFSTPTLRCKFIFILDLITVCWLIKYWNLLILKDTFSPTNEKKKKNLIIKWDHFSFYSVL